MGHLASASAPNSKASHKVAHTHVHTHTAQLRDVGMSVTYKGSSSTVSGDWASVF